MILLSDSPSAPYLATPHLSLHRIGSKHIPSYFALGIVQRIMACIELCVTGGGHRNGTIRVMDISVHSTSQESGAHSSTTPRDQRAKSEC